MIRRAAFLVLAMLATPIAAAPTDIPVKAGRSWQHKASRFTFPTDVGTFKRTEIRDFSDGQRIDLGATYRDENSQVHATLFIYRPAMPQAPLWFDVSNFYLKRNDRFGQISPRGGPIAFGISSNGRSTALRQTYSISLLGRSTGVAVTGFGRWIVKLRMTSPLLEPAALDEALRTFLIALPWRPEMLGTVEHQPLSVCGKPLTALEKAEQIKQDLGLVTVGAMLAMAAEGVEDEEMPTPRRLCRDDSHPAANFPLYQLDEGSTGYVMAIGDNGTLLTVINDRLGASVAATQAKKPELESRPFYRVARMTPSQWEQYAAFAQLPAPQQALDVMDKNNPTSVTTIDGKGSKTTINTSAFE